MPERRLLGAMPYPLARAWWALGTCRMGAEAEKVRCLQSIYEVTVRTLLALTLPDYLRGESQPEVEDLLQKLVRPSWGDYEALLRETLRALRRREKPDVFAPEAPSWYWNAHEKPTAAATILHEVLELRNYDAHKAAPPLGEGEWKDLRAGFEDRLRAVLASLEWLASYRLLHVLQTDLRKTADGRRLYRMQARFLVGIESEPHAEFVDVGEALPTEPRALVYLARPDGSAFLEVSPFLLFRRGQVDTGGGPRARPAIVGRERCLLFKGFDEKIKRVRLVDDAHHVEVTCGVPQGDREVPLDEWLAIRPRDDLWFNTGHWRRESASPEAEPPPGSLCPGYELRGILGRGGMATVYRAFDLKWEKEVALKVLNALPGDAGTSRRRFEQEIALTRRLEHRRIVRIRDRGVTTDDRQFYTMELMEGATLRELVTREGVPEPKVREWARQLLEALAFIHAEGVIHRDVKPENCLLDLPEHGGAIRLGDFGVAHADQSQATRTGERAHLGTDRYKSPEQRRGARDVGPASDVYSLALMLHEMLRGEVPDAPGVGVEGSFGEVLRRMGAPDPRRRPSAKEACELLDASETRSAQEASVARPGRRQWRVAFALSLALCVVLAGFHGRSLVVAPRSSTGAPRELPPAAPAPSSPTLDHAPSESDGVDARAPVEEPSPTLASPVQPARTRVRPSPRVAETFRSGTPTGAAHPDASVGGGQPTPRTPDTVEPETLPSVRDLPSLQPLEGGP